MTNGAAGSAIKGISLVPTNSPVSAGSTPFTETPVYPGVENHLAAGDRGRTRRPSIALSVFTISRDQRLSRWDLVGETESLVTSVSDTCAVVQGADRRVLPQSRDCADGAKASSSPGLEDGVDRGRPCSAAAGPAHHDVQTALSHQDSSGDGLRQRTRTNEREERRRWRLRWRAGCVTDVADVSGLDVYPLPGDPKQHHGNKEADNEEHCDRKAMNEAYVSPATLVAVSGQGLQLFHFGTY